MARKTIKAAIAARENPAAPFLFDEENLPLRHDVVQFVSERKYESTGDRLLDSDVQAARMVELICLGNGIKKVAKLMGFSPHTVRAARNKLVEQGRLAPLKERFVAKCGEIIEEGATAVLDAIVDGRMHPNFIGSTVGIFFDKRALALGEPTAISVGATAQLKPEDLSVKALNSWLSDLPAEGQSTETPSIAEQSAPVSPVGADLGAVSPAPTPVPGQVSPSADPPDPVPASERLDGRPARGGGVAAAGGGVADLHALDGKTIG